MTSKNKYDTIVTYHSMHSIYGYIIGNTAFCNVLVMCRVKFTIIRWFCTNIISHMGADNLTSIYACR